MERETVILAQAVVPAQKTDRVQEVGLEQVEAQVPVAVPAAVVAPVEVQKVGAGLVVEAVAVLGRVTDNLNRTPVSFTRFWQDRPALQSCWPVLLVSE